MGRRTKEEILELQKKWESERKLNNGILDDVEFSDKDVCGQRGCFSYRDGHCECLADTDFNGRACPFFKTVKQYEDDLKQASGASKASKASDKKGEGKAEGSSGMDFLSANADFMDELEELEDEADRIAEGVVESATDTDDGWDDDDAEDSEDDDSGGDGYEGTEVDE